MALAGLSLIYVVILLHSPVQPVLYNAEMHIMTSQVTCDCLDRGRFQRQHEFKPATKKAQHPSRHTEQDNTRT